MTYHRCIIKNDNRGICNVRENKEGVLYTLVYGRLIANNIDPIEKKPLFHFYPGTKTYSIATFGCNFKCLHCYNNSGKKLENELTYKEKLEVAHQIVDIKIFRVCISGGEPMLDKAFWDIAKILKKGKILCNTITNGYLVDEKIAKKMANYFADHGFMLSVSLNARLLRTRYVA